MMCVTSHDNSRYATRPVSQTKSVIGQQNTPSRLPQTMDSLFRMSSGEWQATVEGDARVGPE